MTDIFDDTPYTDPSDKTEKGMDLESTENSGNSDILEGAFEESTEDTADEGSAVGSFRGRRPVVTGEDVLKHHLNGMFQQWYLEYASYVILERAVPHIDDGLKPVQRRILHAMKMLDDGKFNKVANLVGHTMQYHPHGDASIYQALVQLGQKELLIETQGNWGNALTGQEAAAQRYIEARLSPFALDVLYNPKVTEWVMTYDGRQKEPVSLPSKFPLMLVHGADGIAVGLSSKILPHNFNEVIDAAIDYLEGREFTLLPDFFTGGFIDVSRYNDGKRGGTVKIRAKIEKIDNRTLNITEIPYGKTTPVVMESIVKASEKGKIKVKSVEENSTDKASIVVNLQPGTSSDKAIDALYAFTDCEVSVSPNCCVIRDKKPHFLGVSDVLRHNVNTTRNILKLELEIDLSETHEKLLFASLEKIFIEERIYKDKEYEQAPNIEAAVKHIHKRLAPFAGQFLRAITDEDVLRLVEIRMKRIFRFNSDEADAHIAALNAHIDDLKHKLSDINGYTVAWFRNIKEKYGAGRERRTVIRGFDSIMAAQVAEANEKLYLNREEGFIGTALKAGDANNEFVANCSLLDDVILFYKDGTYKVVKIGEKISVGKNVMYVNVFKRNDSRTIYNAIYRNGQNGFYYMKRFAVTGITRDKAYNLTQELPGSRVLWFSANPNGEAETVRVTLKPKLRLKALHFDVDFSELAIKGKNSRGNLVTKNDVQRITLKEKGTSTLAGMQVWFDRDVMRLNYEGRGELLGEFSGDDKILVITANGRYFTTGYALSCHFPDNVSRVEKYEPGKIWTAALYDADQRFPYLKRFEFTLSDKEQSFLGENPASKLLFLTDTPLPRFELIFGGADENRAPVIIDADRFIGVKSLKAKGKRLCQWQLADIIEIEPREQSDDAEDEGGLQVADLMEEEDPEGESLVDESSDEGLFDLPGNNR